MSSFRGAHGSTAATRVLESRQEATHDVVGREPGGAPQMGGLPPPWGAKWGGPTSFVVRGFLPRSAASPAGLRREFFSHHDVRRLGKRPSDRRDYVVLHDRADGVCCHCKPGRLILPSAVAFAGGKTSLRLGTLYDRVGRLVQGYDRDYRGWTELVDFGIRRMAKGHRAGHKNDHGTLRLQPYTSRHGRPEGDPPAQGAAAFGRVQK